MSLKSITNSLGQFTRCPRILELLRVSGDMSRLDKYQGSYIKG